MLKVYYIITIGICPYYMPRARETKVNRLLLLGLESTAETNHGIHMLNNPNGKILRLQAHYQTVIHMIWKNQGSSV